MASAGQGVKLASTNRVSSIYYMRQRYYICPYAIYPIYGHGVTLASNSRMVIYAIYAIYVIWAM